MQCGIISLVSNRKHSTSILTPDDNFPYDLLAKKKVITPDRTIGMKLLTFIQLPFDILYIHILATNWFQIITGYSEYA